MLYLAVTMGRGDCFGGPPSGGGSGGGCLIDDAWQGCQFMSKAPVVITGVGAATPLGNDFATFAANLLAGQSAASAVTDVQAGVEVHLPSCLADDPPAPPNFDANT